MMVYCLVYNHEKYLDKALSSIIAQKTNFDFRLVVHDDASNDNSKSIIEKYASKYRNIIIPIYQSENKYSKDPAAITKAIFSSIDSKYVAICEGDDFWENENKLQIQHDYMETHPECYLCVHNTERINENGNKLDIVFNQEENEVNYGVSDVIRAKGGGLFHTSSFFYRREIRDKMPQYLLRASIGDYPFAIGAALYGPVHYYPLTMSAYRVAAKGSWSQNNKKHPQASLDVRNEIIELLNLLDDDTCSLYHDAIAYAIDQYKYDICSIKGDFHTIIHDKNLLNIYKNKPLKERIKLILKARCIYE